MLIEQILSDRDVKRLLLGTVERARTAKRLSDLYDIPIARCYRKIRLLQAIRLMETERSFVTLRGKVVQLFRSKLNNLEFFIEEGKVRLKMKLSPSLTRYFGRP